MAEIGFNSIGNLVVVHVITGTPWNNFFFFFFIINLSHEKREKRLSPSIEHNDSRHFLFKLHLSRFLILVTSFS